MGIPRGGDDCADGGIDPLRPRAARQRRLRPRRRRSHLALTAAPDARGPRSLRTRRLAPRRARRSRGLMRTVPGAGRLRTASACHVSGSGERPWAPAQRPRPALTLQRSYPPASPRARKARTAGDGTSRSERCRDALCSWREGRGNPDPAVVSWFHVGARMLRRVVGSAWAVPLHLWITSTGTTARSRWRQRSSRRDAATDFRCSS